MQGYFGRFWDETNKNHNNYKIIWLYKIALYFTCICLPISFGCLYFQPRDIELKAFHLQFLYPYH